MAYLINRSDFCAVVLPLDREKLIKCHIITTSNKDSKASNHSPQFYITSLLGNSNIPFIIQQDHSWEAHVVHAEYFQFGRISLAGRSI